MAGLYIHVPFRHNARVYDESDYTLSPSAEEESRFEAALRRELLFYAREYGDDEPISTVYAGGGRPSLLSSQTVHSILTTLVGAFDASEFVEATAEVNPADAKMRYLQGLKRMGFDRLHLQVLSFFPHVLRAYDAPHTADDAIRSLRIAREVGFDHLSVHLLFGSTKQPVAHWKATLRQAVELQVPHISIQEAASSGDRCSEDEQADQLEFAIRFLCSAGYEQYELTHFARPGHRSTHQENYYTHGNYLGAGPSAHTFWWPRRTTNGQAHRWANVSDLDQYADLLSDQHSPVTHRQTLDRKTLAEEYILLSLRTDRGLDLERLHQRYGVDLRAEKGIMIDRLARDGLLLDGGNTVRLSLRGRLLTDAVVDKLVPT